MLLSLSPPDGTTKYVVQVAAGMPSEVELNYFTWRKAILSKYDIFHVHWPEFLLRADSPGRTVVKYLLTILLIAKLRLLKIAVVRTLHNTSPHEEGGPIESILLRMLEGSSSTFYIRLNPETTTNSPLRTVLIPHGHYVDHFAEIEKPEKQDGRILTFGLLRPYKGIDTLVSAFLRLRTDSAYSACQLKIVGKPISESWARELQGLVDAAPKVDLLAEFVPDTSLVQQISLAELVVLPYKKMHNSGAVLLALSLGRPVLVPKNHVNEWIAEEVGKQWVHFFEYPLNHEDLKAALDAVRSPGWGVLSPVFRDRDWASLGIAHHDVYRRALGRSARVDYRDA